MDLLQITQDGSHTVFSEKFAAHYHSVHGAIQESRHVFIQAGLSSYLTTQPKINVLEMGFGTGLNALLTHLKAKEFHRNIAYTSIEAYPLDLSTASRLNYCEVLGSPNFQAYFENYHEAPWGRRVEIDDSFSILKINDLLENVALQPSTYDLVYFDAFSPEEQPELWGQSILEKMYATLKQEGILVTYCAKGQFKRTLKAVGFVIENLPGPPGKREMVRARKV